MNDKKNLDALKTDKGTGKQKKPETSGSGAADSNGSKASEHVIAAGVVQKKIQITGQWAVLAQVADACDLSRSTLTDAADKGAVWLQQPMGKSGEGKYRNPVRIRNFDGGVSSGDLVLVNYNPDVLAAEPITPTLVSDQVNYSIWYKPSGVLSQGSRWSDHTTITCQVEKIHGKRAFLVHRLDRAASGLMVIAHTKNAVAALADLFAKRQVEKTYRAVVHGEYKEILPQLIELPVEDKPAHTEIISAELSSVKTSGSTNADLPMSILSVKIQTGRKHQIRSHLSSISYPVVGDRLFDPDRQHDRDLQLACVELKFDCPFTKKQQSFTLPESLKALA